MLFGNCQQRLIFGLIITSGRVELTSANVVDIAGLMYKLIVRSSNYDNNEIENLR